MKIFTDFDGTITKVDTLNMVLDEFTTDDWRAIEDRVTRHKLTEIEALQAEFDLVNAPIDKVIKFVENNAQIDPTFPGFTLWCKNNNIEIIVLSGGFKDFIQTVFKKFGIKDVPFYSNTFRVENNKWQVIQANTPKIKNLCNHCKTHHVIAARQKRHKVVYIGDGNTDRCPADNADIVFAKASLATHLTQIDKKYYKFDTFEDIQKQLEIKFSNY